MYSGKNKARAIVVIFFLIGVLMGVGVMNFIAAKSRPVKKLTWLESIDSEVTLTNEQKSIIASYIEAHNERMKEIMKVTRPQLDALKTDTRTKIRLSLTPAQQGKYDLLLQRRDAEKAAAEAVAAQSTKAK